jgi:hypothetical protein
LKADFSAFLPSHRVGTRRIPAYENKRIFIILAGLGFSALCTLLNLGLSYLCHIYQIPLFLNAIGMVLAA